MYSVSASAAPCAAAEQGDEATSPRDLSAMDSAMDSAECPPAFPVVDLPTFDDVPMIEVPEMPFTFLKNPCDMFALDMPVCHRLF